MLFDAAVGKGVSLWGKLALLSVGVGGVAVTLVANKDFTFANGISDLFKLRNISIIALALWFGFSGVVQIQGMLAPTSVVESKPLSIERGVKSTEAKVDALAANVKALNPTGDEARAKLAKSMSGLWGEPGCDVTWRVAIDGAALRATLEKKPVGQGAFELLASITSATATQLSVVGETPQAAKGRAATFVLDQSGAIPKLTWDDRSSDVPLVLEPCAS